MGYAWVNEACPMWTRHVSQCHMSHSYGICLSEWGMSHVNEARVAMSHVAFIWDMPNWLRHVPCEQGTWHMFHVYEARDICPMWIDVLSVYSSVDAYTQSTSYCKGRILLQIRPKHFTWRIHRPLTDTPRALHIQIHIQRDRYCCRGTDTVADTPRSLQLTDTPSVDGYTQSTSYSKRQILLQSVAVFHLEHVCCSVSQCFTQSTLHSFLRVSTSYSTSLHPLWDT